MNATMMNVPLSLNSFLDRANLYYRGVEIVSRRPDKSLHRYTYGDMVTRAKALAEYLQQIGVKPGDRVATLMWNHYAHLECYFGIPATGAVLHTLNLRLFPDDIAYIANHAQDRILIVDDVLLPLLGQFADSVNFEKIIVFPFGGEPVDEQYLNYESVLSEASGSFDYVAVDEFAAAGMCYTSGTTGRPKGVVYSHRSTVLHALTSTTLGCIGLHSDDAICPVVPMFHVNAWGLPYAATLCGAKQVLPGPHLDAESLLDLFEKEHVTKTAGVPTIWLGILDKLNNEPKRWQLIEDMEMIVGGSAVPESMIQAFDSYGLKVIQAWGMTETSPLASVSRVSKKSTIPEDQHTEFRAKQGVAPPLVDLRIVNDDGDECPWDGESMGELQVRGPWITGAYHDLANSEDNFTTDGWLRTGDVAVVDSHGYMKITDRTKDLIKSGGEWISSVELENSLMGHPAVKEAAVIAVEHPRWAERPLACVVLQAGASVTAGELKDYLADKFVKWWLPEAVEFIDEIPRTSTGKFKKQDLRKRFENYSWR